MVLLICPGFDQAIDTVYLKRILASAMLIHASEFNVSQITGRLVLGSKLLISKGNRFSMP
jgi:hypothetical protein